MGFTNFAKFLIKNPNNILLAPLSGILPLCLQTDRRVINTYTSAYESAYDLVTIRFPVRYKSVPISNLYTDSYPNPCTICKQIVQGPSTRIHTSNSPIVLAFRNNLLKGLSTRAIFHTNPHTIWCKICCQRCPATWICTRVDGPLRPDNYLVNPFVPGILYSSSFWLTASMHSSRSLAFLKVRFTNV
jgi:hypothetical protein